MPQRYVFADDAVIWISLVNWRHFAQLGFEHCTCYKQPITCHQLVQKHQCIIYSEYWFDQHQGNIINVGKLSFQDTRKGCEVVATVWAMIDFNLFKQLKLAITKSANDVKVIYALRFIPQFFFPQLKFLIPMGIFNSSKIYIYKSVSII